MRKGIVVIAPLLIVLCALTVVRAHEAKMNLPAGPIRDRHELMEGVGKNAKIIGDAMKSGKLDPVAGAAEKIQASATKVTALFPLGSTHEKSRAKPEIWQNWAKFEDLTKQLEAKAAALATAAKSGSDVKGAADNMFGTCKSCHDDFRVPEKKKK